MVFEINGANSFNIRLFNKSGPIAFPRSNDFIIASRSSGSMLISER